MDLPQCRSLCGGPDSRTDSRNPNALRPGLNPQAVPTIPECC